MKKLVLFLGIAFFLSACEQLAERSGTNNQSPMTFKPIAVNYPETAQDTSVKDDYHGVEVKDPYRWLEDDNAENTIEWVKSQNKTTANYIEQIPFKQAIAKRLEKLWNYERYSAPSKKGGKYYYFKNDGLQNQAVMYAQETIDGPATEVMNPNQFSADGTAALSSHSFSKDGRYLAYQVSKGGSDWNTAYVQDLTTEKVLEDQLEWLKFSSLSWFGEGFFYCRYPEPEGEEALSGANVFQQVYYHKIGTAQEADELIFADRANPRRGFSTETSGDQQFLVMGIWESTSGNAMYFKNLKQANADFIPMVESFDSDFIFIDNIDQQLLFLTNYKASNWRLVSVHADHPEEGFWQELIPEGKDVLQEVHLAGDKIIASYIHNAASKLSIFDLKGKLLVESLELPGIGTVEEIHSNKGDKEAFFSFSSFIRPPTTYLLDMDQLIIQLFKAPNIDFKSEDYVTEQLWYDSYDGKRVPMFVTHKKGIELDGNRPTLLYGYGGFDISILAAFNRTRLNLAPVFLENGGVFAVANIRGGGEFGKEWHQAGTKDRKQNVFNDFQAAAEYLIAQRYTSSDKLAIYGRSNGGLLVGACMTQRPDLFKVALPAVGVLDMLRYQEFTIGRAWASDYGLSENPKEFDFLYQYSPLHNVVPANYPATMVTTADHDDRVVPAHSFKFAAALQANQKGEAPVIIRVETSAGHGAGKPTSKKIEEAADLLSFTFYNLEEDIIYPDPMKN